MNIVKSASKLSNAFITLYREKLQGTRYGQFRPSNYLHKRWSYFYNPMINSEINDGFDGALVPGQGFQDFTRNLSWQIQVGNKKYPELNVNHCLKHSTFYEELFITTTQSRTH